LGRFYYIIRLRKSDCISENINKRKCVFSSCRYQSRYGDSDNTVLYSTVGKIALLPRISMILTDLPFLFKIFQLFIKVSFAIIINKVQDQTFEYAGIDLLSDCYSHIQFWTSWDY
jgi:hypothetical protein